MLHRLHSETYVTAESIPLVGWGISAATAALITEAIGWLAAVDFAKSTLETADNKTEKSEDEESEPDFEYP